MPVSQDRLALSPVMTKMHRSGMVVGKTLVSPEFDIEEEGSGLPSLPGIMGPHPGDGHGQCCYRLEGYRQQGTYPHGSPIVLHVSSLPALHDRNPLSLSLSKRPGDAIGSCRIDLRSTL